MRRCDMNAMTPVYQDQKEMAAANESMRQQDECQMHLDKIMAK